MQLQKVGLELPVAVVKMAESHGRAPTMTRGEAECIENVFGKVQQDAMIYIAAMLVAGQIVG